MDEIKEQFKEVKRVWGVAYTNAQSNPTAWKPHLPNTSLEVLNEALDTIATWIERSRAPNGFSPGYHLAKSLAAVHIPNLLATAKQLEAGSYNYIPNFVSQLVNSLSAIHTMAVYAPKNDQETINADFTAELAQSLSLLNTAQEELAEKLVILGNAQELAEEITKSHDAIQTTEKSIEVHKSVLMKL